MNSMTRNNELSVGVTILDCDHREMSETINELRTASVRDQDRRRIVQLLRKLADFSLTHFALEEGMMAATRYPGMALHRLHHQQMIERLNAVASQYKRGDLALNHQILGLLSHWHTIHTESDDLHYGLWLNAVGRR